ncbi:MAG: hypothetical protein U1A72_11705 [Sulfuritalea sp.]|nr:hypothetical protein [Sulfuritalea sp.]
MKIVDIRVRNGELIAAKFGRLFGTDDGSSVELILQEWDGPGSKVAWWSGKSGFCGSAMNSPSGIRRFLACDVESEWLQ